MENDCVATFVHNLMLGDLLPGIPYAVDEKVGQRFGLQVLDRFRNPYIEHRWLAITMQYTMKMQMRNVPTLLHYYKRFNTAPQYMAMGFAAYLLFMRGTRQEGKTWHGTANGTAYPINDDQAGYFAELWARNLSAAELTTTVLQNQTLWGHDLSQLPGFAKRVSDNLQQMLETGVSATVAKHLNKKATLVK
jgi:tagaturonate reductase